MKLQWIIKPYAELTTDELYDAMYLRQEVFVVEQNCVFIDADNKDQFCTHVFGKLGDDTVAYSRIVPAGVSYHEISIGRVLTTPKWRHKGFGRELMKVTLKHIDSHFSPQPIRIEAQLYLKRFYEDFGFIAQGEVYILDGIDHVIMLRS